jgi:putative nucleotidyltransferase with HDIG domain
VDEESGVARRVEENDSSLVPVPVDTIPLSIALPCSIYVKLGEKYPVLRSQGERISARRILSLQDHGVQVLYVHKAVWSVFTASLENLELPQPVTPEAAAVHLRHLLLTYGQELERKIREPKKPLFVKLQRMSEALAMTIRQDPALGSQLLRKYTDPSVSFVGHAVNTAIYVAIIAYKMKFTAEDMKLATYAALVHDIGELFIPKSIRYKKFEFTPEEKEQLNTHARLGAELLQSMGAPPAVVLTALQHHERNDGMGYPSRLRSEQIHPFAKLCAVADTYDSLTSNKPYREALSPAAAIEKMRSFQGQFDPQILGMVSGS